MKLKLNKSHWILIILGFAVLLFFYWPFLRWMINSWIANDYYSHGFLIPIITAFIIWTKRSLLKTGNPSILLSIIFLILSVVMYIMGIQSYTRVLGVLSLISLLFSLAFYFWGKAVYKVLLFPIAFLFFMVPFDFVQDLAFKLQSVSVYSAAWLAQVFGLPIKRVGAEIHLGEVTFTVGIVCSGINTLVALLALAAIYAFVLKGQVIKRSLVFILAFPLAIGANILRIVSIILVAHYVDVEIAIGWYHDISSAIFFFISFALLILTAYLLKLKINIEILGKR